MKRRINFYTLYERLVRMTPEKPLPETVEYQVLARTYPHLARSIMLKKEIERLEEGLKSTRTRLTRFQTRKETKDIRAKLKRENLLKHLHGESREETAFCIHFKLNAMKNRSFAFATWLFTLLKDLHLKVRRILLSSVLDLKSMYAVERSQTIMEWLHEHQKRPNKKTLRRIKFPEKRLRRKLPEKSSR